MVPGSATRALIRLWGRPAKRPTAYCDADCDADCARGECGRRDADCDTTDYAERCEVYCEADSAGNCGCDYY